MVLSGQGENRRVDEEPKLRPLPPPPRCRGIPLGDGNHTGCAYGYGDLAPFTGPRDCPVCNGSGFEGLNLLTLFAVRNPAMRRSMATSRKHAYRVIGDLLASDRRLYEHHMSKARADGFITGADVPF